MTLASFLVQLNEIERIFKATEIEYFREYFPKYENFRFSEFRRLPYKEVWERFWKLRLCNFQLADSSLIQLMRYEIDGLPCYSYAYVEAPHVVPTYVQFLKDHNLNIRDTGDIFREDYEEFLHSAPLKDTVTPARYDFAPHSYKEGIHPAAHFHLGYSSTIRIGTKKLLNPISFVLFILRQYYPTNWALLLKKPIPTSWFKSVRISLEDIPKRYFGDKDMLEMHLR